MIKKSHKILDVLFPPICFVCLCEVETSGLCKDCYKNIKFLGEDVCSVCGIPIYNDDSDGIIGLEPMVLKPTVLKPTVFKPMVSVFESGYTEDMYGSRICHVCRRHPLYITAARSVCLYSDFTKHFVLSLKYGSAFYMVPFLGHMMISCIPKDWDIDYITSIPLSFFKKMYRGYNQSTLLAYFVAQQQHIPYKNLLNRRLWYVHSEKSRTKRVQDQQSSLTIGKNVRKIIHGKNILLVDDVLTTGATLSMCAKILKQNGARNVYGITALRTLLS